MRSFGWRRSGSVGSWKALVAFSATFKKTWRLKIGVEVGVEGMRLCDLHGDVEVLVCEIVEPPVPLCVEVVEKLFKLDQT